MLEGLLSVVSCYGLSILLVHILYWYVHRTSHPIKREHYVLISDHNQLQMEWVLRCLWLYSWIKGKNVSVTLIDHCSTDDTLAIARKLGKRMEMEIRSVHSKQELHDVVPTSCSSHLYTQVVTVVLNKQEDLKKIPLY